MHCPSSLTAALSAVQQRQKQSANSQSTDIEMRSTSAAKVHESNSLRAKLTRLSGLVYEHVDWCERMEDMRGFIAQFINQIEGLWFFLLLSLKFLLLFLLNFCFKCSICSGLRVSSALIVWLHVVCVCILFFMVKSTDFYSVCFSAFVRVSFLGNASKPDQPIPDYSIESLTLKPRQQPQQQQQHQPQTGFRFRH